MLCSESADSKFRDEEIQRSREASKSKEKTKKKGADGDAGGSQQQKRSSHYLIKPICLVIFLVLLVSQLKAIELPVESNRKNVEPSEATAENSTVAPDVRKPNRHDDELVGLNYSDNEFSTRSLSANLGTSKHSAEPLEVASTITHQQIVVDADPDVSKERDKPSDIIAPLNEAPSGPVTPEPSSTRTLAEMTAAGTAAGLLFHDLMSQANMQLNQNQAYQQPDMFNGVHSIGREMADLDDDSSAGVPGRQEVSDGDDDDEADGQLGARNGHFYDRAHAANGLNSMERPEKSRVYFDEQNSLTPELEPGSNARSQAAESPDEAPAPSEDQTPDSMESLMKGEGDNYSDAGDDNQHSTADSNLVNQQPAAPLPLSAANVADRNMQAEGDDDEDDEESLLISPDTNRELSVRPQASAGLTNNVIQGYPIGMPLLENDANIDLTRPIGQNLFMPSIRDSQVDLNTAAGHYYGKKKKKKVKKKKKKKKIVIKKKKKKKVKIYKVKKYKKKKKKKPKKKKMMHHDHGKYYMYAKVPKKKSWEFGFKKGNKKHWIERHEKGHKNKFKTKVKWYDKKSKGKGVHIWDYNHHDKKKKKHYG